MHVVMIVAVMRVRLHVHGRDREQKLLDSAIS